MKLELSELEEEEGKLLIKEESWLACFRLKELTSSPSFHSPPSLNYSARSSRENFAFAYWKQLLSYERRCVGRSLFLVRLGPPMSGVWLIMKVASFS